MPDPELERYDELQHGEERRRAELKQWKLELAIEKSERWRWPRRIFVAAVAIFYAHTISGLALAIVTFAVVPLVLFYLGERDHKREAERAQERAERAMDERSSEEAE